MASGSARRLAPWICLAAVLIGFLFAVARLKPANWFGFFDDDTVYFSSAKAMAEGRGYILPSFPGNPSATHYPPAFSWVLSWIWRWWPSFPANLTPAFCVVLIFTCWFLIASFLFLRKLPGMGDWPALGCVALCAFHPFFLPFGVLLLSDAPFLAVALTAAMLADSALRRDGRLWVAIAAGGSAGISAELRTVGLAVIAGIFFAGLYRRAWKQTAITVLVAAPLLTLALWPFIAGLRYHAGLQSSPAELGWTQTLAYTTSYLKFWRLCVPDAPFFFEMLWKNLLTFLIEPGIFITLPVETHSLAVAAIALILSGAIFMGIVRQARAKEWKPLHFMFVFNAAMILPWNYPLMGRFLLLFVPLFYAGLWVEGKRFFGTLGSSVRAGRPGAERILAAAMGVGILVLGVIAARNYFVGVREQLTLISRNRGVMLMEKKEAYDWIRQNTNLRDPIVAYEDAALYLYTGRLSVRPIDFSTESTYREDGASVRRDLAHITDTARHVRARYWMMAADDYQQENIKPAALLDARMAELKSVLPAVFRSHSGRVEIRELTCLNEPQRPECGAAASVLFPANGTASH